MREPAPTAAKPPLIVYLVTNDLNFIMLARRIFGEITDVVPRVVVCENAAAPMIGIDPFDEVVHYLTHHPVRFPGVLVYGTFEGGDPLRLFERVKREGIVFPFLYLAHEVDSDVAAKLVEQRAHVHPISRGIHVLETLLEQIALRRTL